MIKVDLEARLALAGVVEANVADLVVYLETLLNEPADEVEAAKGEAIDWMEGKAGV